MSIELLIFGLEGVLFDTTEAHDASLASAFNAFGFDKQAPAQQSELELAGAASALPSEKRMNAELLQAKARHFREWIVEKGAPVNPQAVQMIEYARANGCKLAVATDMSSYEAGLLLEREFGNAMHDVFSVIATGADFSAPAEYGPYRLIQRTMDIDSRSCAVIEATEAGTGAAHRAGLRTLPMVFRKDAADVSEAGLDDDAADKANRRTVRESGKDGTAPGPELFHFSRQGGQRREPAENKGIPVRIGADISTNWGRP